MPVSDGITDAAIIEAEIIFARFALHGEVLTQFVCVNNVDKADAPSIKHAIDDVVERYLDLPNNKLVGSDQHVVGDTLL